MIGDARQIRNQVVNQKFIGCRRLGGQSSGQRAKGKSFSSVLVYQASSTRSPR